MTDETMSLPHADDWLDMPASLLSESGVVRLREPRGSNVSQLLARLRSGDYAKPFVVDDGQVRRLHFSLEFVQSEMRIDEPYALNFAYTRKMMAFLLFRPRPRHVVIVGLGGGSLTKFCHHQLPRVRTTTVEIDPDVLAFAELFHVPVPNARLQLLQADAADYFATTHEAADVVLLDGCDKHGIAPAFREPQFYEDLRARLRPDGLLVMNLIGKPAVVKEHLRIVAGAFSGRMMVHKVSAGGNHILFAFNDAEYVPDWEAIQETARGLAQQHGLDFPAFARKLRRSAQYQAVAGR